MNKRSISPSFARSTSARRRGAIAALTAAAVCLGCAGTQRSTRQPDGKESVKPLLQPEKKADPRVKQPGSKPQAQNGRPSRRAVESSLLPHIALPKKTSRFHQRGTASYYASTFHGRRTASGERYNKRGLTAAHPTLPFGTRIRVTNLSNGKSVVVRVNDRGPFTKRRIIDLSYAAAKRIDMIRDGTVHVSVETAE